MPDNSKNSSSGDVNNFVQEFNTRAYGDVVESVTIDKYGSVVKGSNNEASRYVLKDVYVELSYGVELDVNVQPVKKNGGNDECPSSQRKTATNLKKEEQKRRRYFDKNEKNFIQVKKEQKMGPRSVYIQSALPFVHAAG